MVSVAAEAAVAQRNFIQDMYSCRSKHASTLERERRNEHTGKEAAQREAENFTHNNQTIDICTPEDIHTRTELPTKSRTHRGQQTQNNNSIQYSTVST